MIYVKNTTDLFQITEEIKKNSWIYSQDGQELKFATGFLQKTKVVFLCIWNLTWFFGKSTDQAILNLFPDEIRDFILEIEKIQEVSAKTFSSIDEPVLGWTRRISRWISSRFICDFYEIKEIIESSPSALKIANSIDKTFIEQKNIEVWDENFLRSFPTPSANHITTSRIKLLEQTSFVFRSAFIANKYFTSEVYGKLKISLEQAKNIGSVCYIGEVKNGRPAGEGKIDQILFNGTRVIATGTFASSIMSLYSHIIDGEIECNYPDAPKIKVIYEKGQEINRTEGETARAKNAYSTIN